MRDWASRLCQVCLVSNPTLNPSIFEGIQSCGFEAWAATDNILYFCLLTFQQQVIWAGFGRSAGNWLHLITLWRGARSVASFILSLGATSLGWSRKVGIQMNPSLWVASFAGQRLWGLYLESWVCRPEPGCRSLIYKAMRAILATLKV